MHFGNLVGILTMTKFFNHGGACRHGGGGCLLASTPALAAAPVSANGTATVKIYSPLTIAAPTATDAVVDFGIPPPGGRPSAPAPRPIS